MRRALTVGGLTVLLVLLAASPALAVGFHPVLVPADIPIVGSIWHAITGAVVGAFSWTTKLAASFILNTLGGFIKLLIPRSWAQDGLQVMQWLVAVPNYAGKISTPGGGHAYGFPGINDLRELFEWVGIAIAPLTVVYATSRAMIGEGEPVGLPIIRMAGVAALVASYPWWWSQASALTNQITAAILGVPAVANGLDKLMQYAVLGVALGGWQLIDLGTMAAIGLELLAMIFVKVAIILLGAVLYATGPVMIGVAPTRSGHAVARAWITAAVTLLGLGIMWATLLAVGALLINDASTAGPLVAGNTTFGSLMGGLLLAVAGAVSLWLCIKASREAVSLLRLQFGSMLAVTNDLRSGATSTTAVTRERTTGASLREYASRGTRAAGAAAVGGVSSDGTLAAAGGYAGSIGSSALSIGRRGLIGTAAVAAGSAAKSDPVKRMLSRTRAGEAAVKMAKAGSANWASTGAAAGGSERVGTTGGNDDAAQPRHQSDRRKPAAEAQRADTGGHQQAGRAAAQAGKPKSAANPAQPRAHHPVTGAHHGSPTNSEKPVSTDRRSPQQTPATQASGGPGQTPSATARSAGEPGARPAAKSSSPPGTGPGANTGSPTGNPQGAEQAGPTARRQARPTAPTNANPAVPPTSSKPAGPASATPPTAPRATTPAPGPGAPARKRATRSTPPSASPSGENAASPPRSKPPVERIRPSRQPDRNPDA